MKLLVWLCALAAGSAAALGVAAFEDGRADDAARHFADAASDNPSASLCMNLALAELHAGRPDAAEAAAERAALAGGRAWFSARDFLLGAAAWKRSFVLETRADLPGAGKDPFAGALAATHEALAAWRSACSSKSDWPAARRNVERALFRIEALRARQEERAREARTRPVTEQPLPPPPPAAATAPGPEPVPPADPGRLDKQALDALLAELAAREREKRRVRVAERATRSGEDW